MVQQVTPPFQKAGRLSPRYHELVYTIGDTPHSLLGLTTAVSSFMAYTYISRINSKSESPLGPGRSRELNLPRRGPRNSPIAWARKPLQVATAWWNNSVSGLLFPLLVFVQHPKYFCVHAVICLFPKWGSAVQAAHYSGAFGGVLQTKIWP